MKLTVEFLGLARGLTQTKESVLQVEDSTTLRDVLHLLAAEYPPLVGPVLDPVTHELTPSYMLNLDGRRVARDLDERPRDGQRLILMFVEAGG